MNPEEILRKYASGSIEDAEKTTFQQWLKTLSEDEYHQLLMKYEQIMLKETPAGSYDPELLEAISRRIAALQPSSIMMPNRRFWLRWAAAAIILLLGAGVWLAIYNRNSAPLATRDVKAPVLAQATLTLANGVAIRLDSAGNGSLADQGSAKVTKLADGQLAYDASGKADDMMYNTLTVPRGSKVVSLRLSDGTRVWLNSESSLHYPAAFGPGGRKVEITGEAYFEVSRDPARKFLVVDGDAVTEVLGTNFNVNAYKDNTKIKVTLLEGKVKVRSATAERLILPAEQAGINADGAITLAEKTDLEAVIAWKNGLFKFDDEDLQSVMEQIHRWYNLDIVYEGKMKPLNFGGVISRRENVSAVLDLLQLTGAVKFRIVPPTDGTTAGKVIVVL
jgi:transmembrane sensor